MEPTAPADAPAPSEEQSVSRDERRLRAVLDALRTLLRDAFTALHGHQLPSVEELPLALHLNARPQEGWALSLAEPFEEQMAAALDAAQATPGAYEEGRVFCHRCLSPRCEHSAPEQPWEVFRGYDATGRPTWGDFAQAVLDSKDARVDKLYATPPAILALVQKGSELRREQLSAFGRASRNYSILGQVAAGFLPLPNASRPRSDHLGGGARMALTVQVVEARDSSGKLALRLNTISAGLELADWQELLASAWCPWVGRTLKSATQQLDGLQRQITTARETSRTEAALSPHTSPAPKPTELYRRIPALLRGLAQRLERGGRREDTRTRHAAVRHEQRRPVHKALQDLKEARDEHCFHDLHRQTWVILGRQGRAHVFSEDGKLVTSLLLTAANAEFRVRTGRWRAATAEEFESCRAKVLAARSRTHRDTPPRSHPPGGGR
jgi:hypothetical protein